MRPIIIDMKDLSESTEIYEKKPNPAVVGFVYVLLGFILIVFLWMAVSTIDTVTEGDGVILEASSLEGDMYSEREKTYVAKVALAYADLVKIHEGQKVIFEISGFPVSKYGILTGRVSGVAKGEEADPEYGIAFFPIWIDCDVAELTSESGEAVPLVSGLRCHIKIVTERKNTLRYVMECIR